MVLGVDVVLGAGVVFGVGAGAAGVNVSALLGP